MAIYRLFFVGHNKHFVGADVMDCPTDDDAIALASLSCRDHRTVEVWELARGVGVIDANAFEAMAARRERRHHAGGVEVSGRTRGTPPMGDSMSHKFSLGQAVVFSPGAYEVLKITARGKITRLLPREGAEYQYAVELDSDGLQRRVLERQLRSVSDLSLQ